jgi:hypothetical protein
MRLCNAGDLILKLSTDRQSLAHNQKIYKIRTSDRFYTTHSDDDSYTDSAL